jgi:hypothetical protein
MVLRLARDRVQPEIYAETLILAASLRASGHVRSPGMAGTQRSAFLLELEFL